MQNIWLVLESALVFLIYALKQKEIAALKKSIHSMRKYESDRKFRCELSFARDVANHDNNPAAFEESYDHLGYSVEELHRMADQGHIEALGNWPAHNYEQSPEYIRSLRKNQEKRAEYLRAKAQRIVKLEAQIDDIERHEAMRNMRGLMAFDRDQADAFDMPELFTEQWSCAGYSLETLNCLADQGYIEAQGLWPGRDYFWAEGPMARTREIMRKRSLLLRAGKHARQIIGPSGFSINPIRLRLDNI